MRSMTGYGSGEGKIGKGRIFVEVKSVNHRYCDIQLKIPPRMNSLDPGIRTLIKNDIERGKVELFLKEKREIVDIRDLSLNVPLAKKYHRCLKKLQKELGPSKKDVHLLEVVDVRELISVEDVTVDYLKYWNSIRQVISVAIDKMNKMRDREGAFICIDQKKRLNKIAELVRHIHGQADVGVKKYQERMKNRLERSLGAEVISKEKMDSEIAIIADKMDIAEELTRLRSHISQYQHILGQKGAVGRQLDFLLQEINREVNTVGSKACDAAVSSYVVAVKSELEKLREQVQNIE